MKGRFIMKKVLSIILIIAMTISLAACSSGNDSAAEQPVNNTASDSGELTKPVILRFASSGSGGSDYADIGTILTFLSSDGILPKGSILTQETISGGTSTSGYLIEAGMADIVRGQNAVAGLVGIDGRPPYSKVRALFAAGGNSICAQLVSQIFKDKSGYTTIEEIVENKYPARICSEDVGSTDYILLDYIFEILGVTREEFLAWGGKIVYTDNNTASEMIQDGQADIMVMATTLTSSLITELNMTTDIIISAFDESVVDGLLERGFAERMIPAGTFEQFPEEKRTAFVGTSLIVHEDMDDATAYTITKALMENRDKLGESCATMRGITDESAVNTDITVVPLHPGSIKYFQEVGVLE
jgi:TRAP transporter TAXI family solute receptor